MSPILIKGLIHPNIKISLCFTHPHSRAVQYDDMYRMDEIKSLSFHVLSFISWCQKIHCLRKYLFIIWVTAIFIRRPHGGVRRRQKQVENDKPGQNEELVPKRGTTSVAWSRVFKHCRFKTTDFKPLKIKQHSYMHVPSLSVWEERAFSFADFEQLHKHTYMCQNLRLCKYPHKHSDLGLKRVNGKKRKRLCNVNSNLAILDPDFGFKRGSCPIFVLSAIHVNHSTLLENLSLLLTKSLL